jgi:cytochrome c oxidase subunit 3
MESRIMDKALKEKVQKALLWIGIVSIIMMFAGLTSAYIIRQGEGNWINFELPIEFSISTAILLISSLTMNLTLQAVKQDNTKNAKSTLMLTYILGWAFVFMQFKAWGALVRQGIFLVGNASGSYLYILSGLHLAHIIGGIIFLSIILVKLNAKKYDAQNYLPIKLCAIYWHFVDILWVYLFLFLLFIR